MDNSNLPVIPQDNFIVLEDNLADMHDEKVVLDENTIILTSGDTYSQIYTAMTAVLNNNPGPIGLWAASSGFLDGAVDAINDAGRDNVTITAVDISNTELARMVSCPLYRACAAVDPYVIGQVDVRLAVLKTLGVETPETFALDAVNIYGAEITDADSMTTLSDKFADFGWTEAFNTEEIKALRDEYAK